MCGEVDEIDYLAFPITKKGKVEGYILRKEAFKDKAEKWCYIGEYGVRHELSGQFVCTPSKHKHLIVCEGQLDYLKPDNLSRPPLRTSTFSHQNVLRFRR
jgi:hypothetical protein